MQETGKCKRTDTTFIYGVCSRRRRHPTVSASIRLMTHGAEKEAKDKRPTNMYLYMYSVLVLVLVLCTGLCLPCSLCYWH